MSSPRPWGCFQRRKNDGDDVYVFPTPVGVFLNRNAHIGFSLSLPHARGGVSPDDILANPKGFVIPTDMGVLYAVTIAVALAVKNPTQENYLEFLGMLPPEFGVMGMKTTMTSFPDIKKAKGLLGWLDINKGLVL